MRQLKEDNQSLREEVEDANAALSTQERQNKHAFAELEARHATLQASVEDMQRDLDGKVAALQGVQQRLAAAEAEKGGLENEILRLKAQGGDADVLGVVKRELSEQVTHIRKLEAQNRELAAEVKGLRRERKSVEIVEEEKRALERKVGMMEDLRRELTEAQLQRQILEEERRSWSSYLESENAGREEMKFDSPEEMARAFVRERMERLTLVEKLGAVQPELAIRDDNVRVLQEEKSKLQTELEKMKASGAGAGAGDAKARARLERQKNLAQKEVEYLRAQIKTFEEEEKEFNPSSVDESSSAKIQQLEALIDEYKSEVNTLQADLSKLEKPASTPAAPATPSLKRPLDDSSDDRLGEHKRKIRVLQSDLETLQTRNATLTADLKATTSHLRALKESSKTRILSLRDNPTARAEAIKQSTLATLQTANAALLATLENGSPPANTKVVPISVLESARIQIKELEETIAQRDKKQSRLKQIWSAKFLEFAEAVAATLGWRVHFQPNGRFKVTSILYPTSVNAEGEEEENSILFDGEQGTMKVSGGRESVFAQEIRGLIEFWVDGRKEVPCFLAACTLEFYERSTRGQG